MLSSTKGETKETENRQLPVRAASALTKKRKIERDWKRTAITPNQPTHPYNAISSIGQHTKSPPLVSNLAHSLAHRSGSG